MPDKQRNNKHLWSRLSSSIEKQYEYKCRCSRGGKIYLGLRLAKWVNIAIIVIPLVIINIWQIIDMEFVPAMIVDLLLVGIFTRGYVDLYRAMRKDKHSTKCSRGAAILGNLYSGRGSSYSIYPPKE